MSVPHIAELSRHENEEPVRQTTDCHPVDDVILPVQGSVTEDAILPDSALLNPWAEFFALVASGDESEDFLAGRPMNVVPRKPERGKGVFGYF